jgi:hypothetical protein
MSCAAICHDGSLGGRVPIDATEQRVSRPLPTKATFLAKKAISLKTQVVAETTLTTWPLVFACLVPCS